MGKLQGKNAFRNSTTVNNSFLFCEAACAWCVISGLDIFLADKVTVTGIMQTISFCHSVLCIREKNIAYVVVSSDRVCFFCIFFLCPAVHLFKEVYRQFCEKRSSDLYLLICCVAVLFFIHHLLFRFENGWVHFMDSYPVYYHGEES